MTSELPRPVYQPPRPAPTEQLAPTIPPSKGAKLLVSVELGIQETIAGMNDLGLNSQRDSVEEILTDIERKCLSNCQP